MTAAVVLVVEYVGAVHSQGSASGHTGQLLVARFAEGGENNMNVTTLPIWYSYHIVFLHIGS